MKTPLLLLLIIVFCSCSNNKPQGVNFLVVQKGDTLSHFYYHGQEKYRIVGKEDSTVLFSRGLQFPGEFVIGVTERENEIYNFLVYREVTNKTQENIEEMSTPFIHSFFKIAEEYETIITENYIDSSEVNLTKYETYAAISTTSNDTILFQEALYKYKESGVVGSLIVYDNLDRREEMRLSLNDAFTIIKKSTKAQQGL